MRLRTANKRRRQRRFWAAFDEVVLGQETADGWSMTITTTGQARGSIASIPIRRRRVLVFGVRFQPFSPWPIDRAIPPRQFHRD